METVFPYRREHFPGTNRRIHIVGNDRNRKEIKLDNKFRNCISCGFRNKVAVVIATTYNKILHNYCEDCYFLYRDQFEGMKRFKLKIVKSRQTKIKEKEIEPL